MPSFLRECTQSELRFLCLQDKLFPCEHVGSVFKFSDFQLFFGQFFCSDLIKYHSEILMASFELEWVTLSMHSPCYLLLIYVFYRSAEMDIWGFWNMADHTWFHFCWWKFGFEKQFSKVL